MNIHRQLHILSRVRLTELNEIFWAMSLKTMALSFVGIFVPIYLYNLGYSLPSIFFYYAVLFFAKAIANDVTARIIVRIGPKHGFVYSFPFLLFYLFMIKTLPEFHWNLYIVAVVSGFGLSLSWLSYHIDFSKVKSRGDGGAKDLSHMQALLTIASAVAPFIGGIIATQYGIGNTFTLAIIVLIIAGIPLLKTREPHIPLRVNMKKVKFEKIKGDLLGAVGLGFNNSALYEIWPFLMFFIVGTYENVGFLESLTLLLTLVTTIYVGKHINHANRHKVLNRGAEVNGLLWFGRFFTTSFFHLIIFNFSQAILSPLLRIPYFSELYIHADEESRVEYLLWSERLLDYGRAFMFLTLTLGAYFLGIREVLGLGIIFGMLGALMTGFIRPAKDEA